MMLLDAALFAVARRIFKNVQSRVSLDHEFEGHDDISKNVFSTCLPRTILQNNDSCHFWCLLLSLLRRRDHNTFTMASNMLPLDDLELEMEEVEGLVEVSTVGSGRNTNKASRASTAVVGAVAGCCSSRYRSRWGCFAFVVLILVIMTLYMRGEKDIEQAEGDKGSHVIDVDAKNVTAAPKEEEAKVTSPPTATPTVKATDPPTASPIAKATPPPTASPTVKATDPPTASPTAKATQEEEKKEGDEKPTEEKTEGDEEIPDKSPKPADEANKDENAEEIPEEETSDGHLDYSFPPTPYAVRTENPPAPSVLEEYKKKWGTWELGELPKMDREAFCGNYEHCDVPRDKFPKDAWQSDTEYMQKFLNEADKLVDRARNAILAEYGKSPGDTEMFDLTYRDDLKRRELKGPPDNGGWTSKRSMDGLARRLVHAIMTRDTFTFIMGGHSAAAGHG